MGFFSYVCRLDVGQHCWYLTKWWGGWEREKSGMKGDDWKGALMELLLWSERCVAKDPSPAVVAAVAAVVVHWREGRGVEVKRVITKR